MKMKNVIKKSVVALLAFICLFFSACNRTSQKTLLDKIKAKGEIVIATEGSWAPWSFHDEKEELTGYDIEIAKEICARLGIRPKFLEMQWEMIFDALENNECDIIINGVAVTPEREELFYYSDPYAYGRTVLIVRKNEEEIRSFKDLNGKTSANSQGSSYGKLAQQYGCIPIVVDTFEDTINLLLENRVDSTLNSNFTYENYIKSNPGVELKIVDRSEKKNAIAIPCRKSPDSLTLLVEINKALEGMRADGSLEKISLKYFDQDVTK